MIEEISKALANQFAEVVSEGITELLTAVFMFLSVCAFAPLVLSVHASGSSTLVCSLRATLWWGLQVSGRESRAHNGERERAMGRGRATERAREGGRGRAREGEDEGEGATCLRRRNRKGRRI